MNQRDYLGNCTKKKETEGSLERALLQKSLKRDGANKRGTYGVDGGKELWGGQNSTEKIGKNPVIPRKERDDSRVPD